LRPAGNDNAGHGAKIACCGFDAVLTVFPGVAK